MDTLQRFLRVRGYRAITVLVAFLICGLAQSAYAQSGNLRIGIVSQPNIVVRGSDLIIPLKALREPVKWPQRIPVLIGNSRVNGELFWLSPSVNLEETKWTTPSSRIAVRSMNVPFRSKAPGEPVLLVSIPENAKGSLKVLGRKWEVDYQSPLPALEGVPLAPIAADAAPILNDPFEYVRWILMAEYSGNTPPPYEGDEFGKRFALALADEWRAGLRRILPTNPRIADQVVEVLTSVAKDWERPSDDREIAAWLTDRAELASLRGILLDKERDAQEAANAALAWIEARPKFFAWIEDFSGDTITVAVVNFTKAQILLHTQWLGEEVSLPNRCRSLTLTKIDIQRPKASSSRRGLVSDELLMWELGHELKSVRLNAGVGVIPVRPPNAAIGPMLLPLSLAAVREGYRDESIAYPTSALLRRRSGRWEVLIDCRWPIATKEDRIFLQVGRDVLVQVRPNGLWKVLAGPEDPEFGIRVRTHDAGWRCEMKLPESWLVQAIDAKANGAVLLGMGRVCNREIRQFAGLAPATWQKTVPLIAFDLGVWADGSQALNSEQQP